MFWEALEEAMLPCEVKSQRLVDDFVVSGHVRSIHPCRPLVALKRQRMLMKRYLAW
jgi:hypothetical protein